MALSFPYLPACSIFDNFLKVVDIAVYLQCGHALFKTCLYPCAVSLGVNPLLLRWQTT